MHDSELNIQHKATFRPEADSGFEGNVRVPVVRPAIYGDQGDAEGGDRGEDRTDFAAKLGALLEWLAAGGNVKKAGRRTILFTHLTGRGGCRTDAELARRLNITAGRFSQLRAEIEAAWPGFGRCNRRQI